MSEVRRIPERIVQKIMTWVTSNEMLAKRFLRVVHQFDINRICKVRNQQITLNISSEVELWRALTYETKEPETLSWIERYFVPHDVFYDIGANIGMYSLYARSLLGPGCLVYAFEPESQNFAQLYRNIFLNRFSGELQAFPLAISDSTRLDHLTLRAFVPGGARHSIGRSLRKNKEERCLQVQSIVCVSLDDLIYQYGLPIPHHIKIDVDGHELPILNGSMKVLADNTLRSILVEVQLEEYDIVVNRLSRYGFHLFSESESTSTSNCIFVRE